MPTLCTADLPDDDQGLQAALQRAAAAGSAAEMQARAALDENGWVTLRRACPALPRRPALDLKLAEQVLADPKLYVAALHAIHAAGRIAPGSIPPAGPSLTDAGAALSSGVVNP